MCQKTSTVMDIRHYRHSGLFYFLSVLIPWIAWLTAAWLSHAEYMGWASVFGFMGLIAPLIIALILILPNETLKRDFLGRLINTRAVPFKYLLVTLLLMPLSILAAQLISLLFGYSADQFQLRGDFTFTSGIFPVWFLLIMAPLIEELAWHSYGTDCLRNRFNLLNTSLLFALFWGIWHLPLSFIRDYYQSNLVESGFLYSLNFIVSLFPFVLIMNWLYYKTNRSIIVSVIFHITAGYFNEIFATHPMSKVIQTGLLLLISIYLIIDNKTFFINTLKFDLK